MDNLVGMDVFDVVVRMPKTLGRDATVAQARAALTDDHVHMLLITDERGLLVGTLVDDDLSAPTLEPEAPAVRCAVTHDRTLPPDMSAQEAMDLLLARGERRRAVVDKDGLLLGLLCLKRRLTGFCSDDDVLARAADPHREVREPSR